MQDVNTSGKKIGKALYVVRVIGLRVIMTTMSMIMITVIINVIVYIIYIFIIIYYIL